jgi:AraC-like DNA-binding protein
MAKPVLPPYAYALSFWRLLVNHAGLNPADFPVLVERAGATSVGDVCAEQYLTVEQYGVLADCIVGALDLQNISSDLAELIWEVGGGALGIFRSKRNFCEMLVDYAKYARLFGGDQVSVHMDDEIVCVTQHAAPHWRKSPPVAFANLLFLLRLARLLSQNALVPLHAELAFDPATDTGLARFLGDITAEHGGRNKLCFTRGDAETPFLTADDELFASISAEFDRRLHRLNARYDLDAELRNAIHLSLLSGNTSLAAVAKTLGFGVRTLQRRLHEAGTCYSTMLDEVRHAQAQRYITDRNLTKAQIAHLIGFRDLNSLYRALKRWRAKEPG